MVPSGFSHVSWLLHWSASSKLERLNHRTETANFRNIYDNCVFLFHLVLVDTLNILDQLELMPTPGDAAHEKPCPIPPRCLQSERTKQSRPRSLLRELRQAAPLHAHILSISRPAMRHPPTATSRRESPNDDSIKAHNQPQLR